jgi:hypothetical protein
VSKKPDFSGRLQKKMARNIKTPASLEEFLKDSPKDSYVNDSVNAEKNISVIFKREEFKFPHSLSEQLRKVSFSQNRKKTDIVQEALSDYFIKIGM